MCFSVIVSILVAVSLFFYSYEIKEPSDGMFGGLHKNGSWSGIIGQLIQNVSHNTDYIFIRCDDLFAIF